MAVLARRTRIVSFRVSEEEYQNLVSICLTQQARSISDFARFVTLSQFKLDGAQGEVESTLQQIHRMLAEIDGEIRRLARLIEMQALDATRTLEVVASSHTP